MILFYGFTRTSLSGKEFLDTVQNNFQCCGATKGTLDYEPALDAKVEANTKFVRPCNNFLFEFVKTNLVLVAGVAIEHTEYCCYFDTGYDFSMNLCCALRNAQMD